jgi:hypothetical protein
MNWKKTAFWIIAFIITISTAVYQRTTGPTHPKTVRVENEGKEYKFTLPRSQNGYKDLEIKLKDEENNFSGMLIYRRYKSQQVFDTIPFIRTGDYLLAHLPKQPAAGKLEYKLQLYFGDNPVSFQEEEMIIVRFKDEVPAWALIPHILFIFTAMLLSNLTAFYAMANFSSYRFYTALTLITFLLGGMILGPVVQKFAFGEFWTGFPHGRDLTDNKSLVGFIFWVIAWLGNRKNGNRKYLVYIAALVNIAVVLIPHSARGSELDYDSGKIQTGFLYLKSFFG